MLTGTTVALRPVSALDLDDLHRHLLDGEARGPWYPLPRTSLTRLRRSFEDSGFWSEDDGIFLIVTPEGGVLGLISWERLNSDTPDVELGYRLFSVADMGAGATTEALRLLTSYLFDTSARTNRLRLVIHVDNVASRRVAEKGGFSKECTAREAWHHCGTWHDVDVFTLTRAEWTAQR